jgi:hypothetical protein
MKTSEAVTYDSQAATEPCMEISEHTEWTEKQHANNERVQPPNLPNLLCKPSLLQKLLKSETVKMFLRPNNLEQKV